MAQCLVEGQDRSLPRTPLPLLRVVVMGLVLVRSDVVVAVVGQRWGLRGPQPSQGEALARMRPPLRPPLLRSGVQELSVPL